MGYDLDKGFTLDEIFNLERLCFPGNFYSKQQLKTMFENKELYDIIGIYGNKEKCYVGYALLFNNSETLEILKIGIIPNLRGQELGKILLKEIIKKRKEVFLEVRETNESAIKFYKKNGFKEISIRKNYYQNPKENAIIMQRKI